MDLAVALVRSVVRAFYETKHVLVVDALITHSAIRDDDLAYLLSMQVKELHKLCGKLKEDRLLAVYSRAETREGQQRPVNRTYYYIDFRQSIDAVKFRVHQITKEAQKALGTTEEKKDWICPRCKSQYTNLEVLDSVVPEGFACHECEALLVRIEENSGIQTGGQQKVSRLMAQLDKVIKLLKNIDEVIVPENNFEHALAHAVLIVRDGLTNPQQEPSLPAQAPSAVRGITISAPKVEVSIKGDDEELEADSAEAKRRAALAAQNALPVWHTTSTVTGDLTTLGKQEVARERELTSTAALLKKEEDDKKAFATSAEDDSIADYYAALAREKAMEEKREREAEESSSGDEDDDDDDFEDVGFGDGSTSGVGDTMDISSSTIQDDSSLYRQNGGSSSKPFRAGSESASSFATGTQGGNTPMAMSTTTAGDGDDSTQPTKKVRIEAPVSIIGAGDDDDDSDEDDAFEDV